MPQLTVIIVYGLCRKSMGPESTVQPAAADSRLPNEVANSAMASLSVLVSLSPRIAGDVTSDVAATGDGRLVQALHVLTAANNIKRM